MVLDYVLSIPKYRVWRSADKGKGRDAIGGSGAGGADSWRQGRRGDRIAGRGQFADCSRDRVLI